MSKDTLTRHVQYQCNKCTKQRTLTIPARILRTENISEIIEFIDVHKCDQDNLSAVKCFIDSHLVVRSQVHIKSTHVGYETVRDFSSISDEKDLYADLGIPAPKKIGMIEVEINSKGFKGKNIVELEIKDKIRNSKYIYGKKGEGKSFTITSTLGFIEVKVVIDEKVANKIYKKWKQEIKTQPHDRKEAFPFNATKKWILQVADKLESLVYLDNDVLLLLAEYLDNNIIEEPTERKLIELDLLINSTIAFPNSSSEEMRRFNNEQAKVYPGVSPNTLILCKELLVYALSNYDKSILYTYNDRSLHKTFPEFLLALSHLVEQKFMKIIRLEFS